MPILPELPRSIGGRLLLLLLVALAAALRFGAIEHRPASTDERDTIRRTEFPTSTEVVHNLGDSGRKQAAYYALVHTAAKRFGSSLTTTRTISAIAGTLSVATIFLLAALLFDRATGMLAATLLAMSGYHIYWSSVGRVYALVVLTTITSTYLLLRAVRGAVPRWRFLWHYIAWASVLMYLHYFGIAMVAIQIFGTFLFALASRAPRIAALASAAFVSLFTLYLPLLPTMFEDAETVVGLHWVLRPSSPAEIFTVLGIFLQRYVEPNMSGGVWVALGCAFALRAARYPSKRRRAWALVAWACAPIFFAFSYSLYNQPIWVPRYLIIAFPPLLLLLAIALRSFVPAERAWILAFTIVAWQISGLGADPRGPWKFKIRQYVALGEACSGVSPPSISCDPAVLGSP